MLFIDVVTYINYLVKNILEYNQQNGISITAGTAWATGIPGDPSFGITNYLPGCRVW